MFSLPRSRCTARPMRQSHTLHSQQPRAGLWWPGQTVVAPFSATTASGVVVCDTDGRQLVDISKKSWTTASRNSRQGSLPLLFGTIHAMPPNWQLLQNDTPDSTAGESRNSANSMERPPHSFLKKNFQTVECCRHNTDSATSQSCCSSMSSRRGFSLTTGAIFPL